MYRFAMFLTALALLASCSKQHVATKKAAAAASVEQVLRVGLDHADPFVRAETLELLARCKVVPWVDKAVQALNDADPLVGMVAARALLSSDKAADGVRHIEERVLSGTAALSMASLRIAFDELPYAQAVPVVSKGLRSSTPAVRREALRLMLDFIRKAKTPDASTARALEQQILTFSTDADPQIVAMVLEYTGAEGRLADLDEGYRAPLYAMAKGADLDQARRALRILTSAADVAMKSFVFDIYRASERQIERVDVYELALIAMALNGDKLHIPELEKLAARDADLDLQRAALSALFAVDDIDAALGLSQALENPSRAVRLHVLAMEQRRPRNLRIPDVLLKDDDADVRLATMQVLWKQDAAKFQRVVAQKLAVEQYRYPILATLNEWAQKPTAEGMPWLKSLESALRGFSAEFMARDDLGAPMTALIVRLDGTDKLLPELPNLSMVAQYVVLEAMLMRDDTTAEVFKPYVDSPFYLVQLAATLGVAKRPKG